MTRLHTLPTPPPLAARSRVADPAFISVEEAAHRLGVGLATARAWVRTGILHTAIVGASGRVRRVPAGEIERLRRDGIGNDPRGGQ